MSHVLFLPQFTDYNRVLEISIIWLESCPSLHKLEARPLLG